MTAPQRNFLQSLLRDRAWDTADLELAHLDRDLNGREGARSTDRITTALASEYIGRLKACPFKPRERAAASQAPAVDVHAGRYAVTLPGEQLRFYRVDRPTEGRWAGRTFVNMYASDERYPVRGERAREVLALIAAAPQEAMERYGRELGKCGHCGRTLTDEESRARGIGPVCAGRMGWS